MGKFLERTEFLLAKGMHPVSGGETDDKTNEEIIAESLQANMDNKPLTNTQTRRLIGALGEKLGLKGEDSIFRLAEILYDYRETL